MKQVQYTYGQFAYAIGAQDRLTLEASEVFHKEYVKATPEAQATLRQEWIEQYVSGNMGITLAQAVKVRALTRKERSKEQEASVQRASKKFEYHVSRTKSSGTSKQVDLVKQALAIYAQMSGAQKRSFKAQL